MKRIVYYTDTTGFGGAEVYLIRICSNLEKTSFELRLALPAFQGNSKLANKCRELGCRVDLVQCVPGTPTLVKIVRTSAYFRRVGPDVVHINRVNNTGGAHAILGARLAGVKNIFVTEHFVVPIRDEFRNRQMISGKELFARTRRIVKKRLSICGVTRVISVSLDNVRKLVCDYHYPRRKVVLIYNGVEIGQSAADDVIDCALAGKNQYPILGFLGRLEERKGCRYLLEAMPTILKRFPHATAWVMGDGVERDKLVALANKLRVSDSVVWWGHVEDVHSKLARIDALVHPALYEPFGFVITEAMSCGKPVIATNVGGIPEIVVPNGTGFLISARSAQGICESVEKMFAEEGVAKRMGRSARVRVEKKFSLGKMVSATSELYLGCKG